MTDRTLTVDFGKYWSSGTLPDLVLMSAPLPGIASRDILPSEIPIDRTKIDDNKVLRILDLKPSGEYTFSQQYILYIGGRAIPFRMPDEDSYLFDLIAHRYPQSDLSLQDQERLKGAVDAANEAQRVADKAAIASAVRLSDRDIIFPSEGGSSGGVTVPGISIKKDGVVKGSVDEIDVHGSGATVTVQANRAVIDIEHGTTGSPTTGLTQPQVDARIQAKVRDFAETATVPAVARTGLATLINAPTTDAEKIDYSSLKNSPSAQIDANAAFVDDMSSESELGRETVNVTTNNELYSTGFTLPKQDGLVIKVTVSATGIDDGSKEFPVDDLLDKDPSSAGQSFTPRKSIEFGNGTHTYRLERTSDREVLFSSDGRDNFTVVFRGEYPDPTQHVRLSTTRGNTRMEYDRTANDISANVPDSVIDDRATSKINELIPENTRNPVPAAGDVGQTPIVDSSLNLRYGRTPDSPTITPGDLPSVAGVEVGTLYNNDGTLYELVAGNTARNVYHGTVKQVDATYIGDDTFSWTSGDNVDNIKGNFAKTAFTSAPPASINIRVHVGSSYYADTEISRASADDTQTTYAYYRTSTEPSLITGRTFDGRHTGFIGDAFSVSAYSDDRYSMPLNILPPNINRWERDDKITAKDTVDPKALAGNTDPWGTSKVPSLSDLGGIGGVTIQKDGVTVGSVGGVTSINISGGGSGVTVTESNGAVTITLPSYIPSQVFDAATFASHTREAGYLYFVKAGM